MKTHFLGNFVNCQFLWYVGMLSHVWFFAALWTVTMEFSRQEYWSGLLFPTLGDLPDPGTHISCVSCIGRWMHHLVSLSVIDFPNQLSCFFLDFIIDEVVCFLVSIFLQPNPFVLVLNLSLVIHLHWCHEGGSSVIWPYGLSITCLFGILKIFDVMRSVFSSVQLLSHVQFFETLWTAAVLVLDWSTNFRLPCSHDKFPLWGSCGRGLLS